VDGGARRGDTARGVTDAAAHVASVASADSTAPAASADDGALIEGWCCITPQSFQRGSDSAGPLQRQRVLRHRLLHGGGRQQLRAFACIVIEDHCVSLNTRSRASSGLLKASPEGEGFHPSQTGTLSLHHTPVQVRVVSRVDSDVR
jgi:hypothetical protein